MGIKEKCTLEEEEKKEVLELAQNHTFGLFIELSLRYSLRPGEIVRLKKCDLHLEKNQIYVGGTKTEKSKRTIRIKEKDNRIKLPKEIESMIYLEVVTALNAKMKRTIGKNGDCEHMKIPIILKKYKY